MRTLIVAPVLALWLASFAAPAAAEEPAADPWLGPDKALHFAASMAVGAGSFTASDLLWDDGTGWQHASVALGSVGFVGVGKELVDLALGKPFSGKDLAWDLAGGVLSVGLSWLVWELCAPAAEPRE